MSGRGTREAPPAPPPHLPEVGVLALVPDRFSALYQPRHQILSRLARYFHVVWVNPAAEWRDALAALARGRGAGSDPAPPGLEIYEPEPWLPVFYKPAGLARRTHDARLARARRALERRGCAQVVLYLWRPGFEAALGALRYDASCYHADDEYSFSSVEAPLDPREARILAAVDQVFLASPALMEKKGHINPHTLFAPNGVDYAAFAAPRPEPADLARVPRPRVGYAGWLKRQLDWQLLGALADRHADLSFVFIGGRHPDDGLDDAVRALAARPNVHLLGPKATAELGAYPQHFDVCIMPYVADDYTKYIYPLKVHEYLAGGRPVVGTRIRSLEAFTGAVELARAAGEWSEALARALRPEADTEERRSARRRVARGHDWDALVARIAGALARRLSADHHARLVRACGFDPCALRVEA